MQKNKKVHKYLSIFIVFYLCNCHCFGQDYGGQKTISLKEALKLAAQSSLDAFKTKRQFGASYWQYRSFEARLLPKINLNLEPFTYNRSFIKRYDPDNNIDVYRQQQNLTTFSQVSISQNIMATGAQVYLNSSFNRLVNYSGETIENYNTTPVRIGIYQPIMAFNELRWLKKTADLEFERAKKAYLHNEQEIYLKTIELFFNWALADTKLEIAVENQKNATRLYDIGKKRYDLGSIEKDDLLNLELEDFMAQTSYNKAIQELEAVISEISLFLGRGNLASYSPELPVMINSLTIEMEEARQYAQENNPELLDIDIRNIEASRDLDKAIKENRFELSLSASYGLNQQANNFADAYSNFLDQQIVAVQFSMPLLDWGERKGKIKMAKMNKEVADIETQQDEIDIYRRLTLAVNNFNLQEEQVVAAFRAKEISRESYKITEKRFLTGKVDLLRLTSSRKAWQTSSEQYIQQLKSYWSYYYQVRKLTLYDFINQSTLSEDFDSLLKG